MAEEGKIGRTEGSTATAVVLLNNELYISYIGNSNAILIQTDTQTFIDLCPEKDVPEGNAKEIERIKNSGGIILKVGNAMRVQGELALTRSLGALKYKPYVIADPHINDYVLNKSSFLVLASDGLWEVLNKEDVLKIIVENKNEEEIVKKLHDEAVKKNATDNITIVVVNIGKKQKFQIEETSEESSSPIIS